MTLRHFLKGIQYGLCKRAKHQEPSSYFTQLPGGWMGWGSEVDGTLFCPLNFLDSEILKEP